MAGVNPATSQDYEEDKRKYGHLINLINMGNEKASHFPGLALPIF